MSWTDRDGSRRSVRTAEPTRTVAELAATFGGEVPGLSVTRPTLEDVYLRDGRSAVTTQVHDTTERLPGTWSIGLRRVRIELLQFVRDREAAFFTMLLPVLLLVVFGSVFTMRSHPASRSASTSWPG